MKIRHLVACAMLLTACIRGASAGEVLMYRTSEAPDPRSVAAILSRSAAQPSIKMRSIHLLPDEPVTTDKVASALAKDGDSAATEKLAAPAVPDSFALPVQFAFDSARILPEATGQLDAVAAGIKLAGPKIKVVIEGHTDAAGSDQYNLVLSGRRAAAVKAYLVSHGISAVQLEVVGMGKSAPLNKENPFASENRRVQFRAVPQGVGVATSGANEHS